ncbi:MAG: carboxymuconolactone decarboxylase family protein [Pseudomonadota bacterium]
MSTRITLLSIDEAKAAATKADIPAPKYAASIYRLLLHHPELAKRINDLVETLLAADNLAPDIRELMIMRIGWWNEGVYEWTQHWRIAQQLGLDMSDLLAVRDWSSHQHWSSAQVVALTVTDEILSTGVVSDSTWDALSQIWPTEREQLELLATVGTWKMISDMLKCLKLPLEEGLAPWPPDGISPSAHEHRSA